MNNLTKIIIIILIVILIYTNFNFINIEKFSQVQNYNNKTEPEKNSKDIPKIIHQTAPKDLSKWRPEWYSCYNTWKQHFPKSEYKHVMWYDEDLENLIKNDFPWFYPLYMSYDKKIKKIDIARYFILYKYGGIYADMDYMCTKNFYDLIPKNIISISESPFKENEYIQNALMISPPKCEFWMKVITEAISRMDEPDVLNSTGPKLLSDIYFKNMNEVNVLSEKLFNPRKDTLDFYSGDVITKHLGTVSWM